MRAGRAECRGQTSSPSEQSNAYELSDCSTIASIQSSVADAANVHLDDENEVAHTQAELELDHRLTFGTQTFAFREIVSRYTLQIHLLFWRQVADINAPPASKSTPYNVCQCSKSSYSPLFQGKRGE